MNQEASAAARATERLESDYEYALGKLQQWAHCRNRDVDRIARVIHISDDEAVALLWRLEQVDPGMFPQ